MKQYLGIDVGGTNIAVGVVGEDGTLIAKHSVPTLSHRPFEDVVADMVQAGRTVLDMAGLTQQDVDQVGIGVPSTINQHNGRMVYANNLGWRDQDVSAEFQKHWDIPVHLANDADVAVYAEAVAGAAAAYDSVLMLTLGTGVGGGMLFGKKLFLGGDGFGSEPGHIVLVAGGEPCTCGRIGCFEAYASVTALVRDTIRAMAEHPTTIMRELCGGNLANVSGRTAFQAAKQGDPVGAQVVENYLQYLAEGISSLIILLRPQVVILGGGVCNEGDPLFVPLREKVRPLVYGAEIMGVPPIIKAELGNDAGIIGAALLGVKS